MRRRTRRTWRRVRSRPSSSQRIHDGSNCGMLADGQHVGAHMVRDAHGLEVTTASSAAVQAFDHALMGYLRYRVDTPQRMAAVFEADPEFGLAHCLKGYFAMLAYKQSALPIAEAAAADAARFS